MRAICLTLMLALGAACQEPMRLTLAEAEKLAVQNHPRIAAANLNAKAAGQQPVELRSAYQPQLIGSLTGVGADTASRIAAGGLTNPSLYNRLGAGLAISQLITDFGRTGHLLGASKLHVQAQEQSALATKVDILLETDLAYFGVQRAEAILKVARKTVEARGLVAAQVRALAASQLKSSLDVSFAEVNLQESQLLLVGAEGDYRSTIAILANAIALPNQTAFVLSEEPLPDTLPDTAAPLIRDAATNRPELAALRLELESAERVIKAEKALNYPTLSASGAAGFSPAGQTQVADRYGAFGLNLNIPLWNGGLFRARQLEAEYRAQAASRNVQDLENRVIRDVTSAYLSARTAFDRLALTRKLVEQAELALRLAKTRYDLGISAIVELSQAELNLTTAQIAGETAKFEYESRRSILDVQTGSKR